MKWGLELPKKWHATSPQGERRNRTTSLLRYSATPQA
jgi:hypothetical protein